MVGDTLHLAMRGCEYLEPKAASFGSRMEPPGTFAHLPLDHGQPHQVAIAAGAHKHSTVLWRCKEQTKLSLESESDGTSMSSQCTGPLLFQQEMRSLIIICTCQVLPGRFVYCSFCWQPHHHNRALTIPNIHPKLLGYGQVHPVPLMYIQT